VFLGVEINGRDEIIYPMEVSYLSVRVRYAHVRMQTYAVQGTNTREREGQQSHLHVELPSTSIVPVRE
jgi:hypothetical protein